MIWEIKRYIKKGRHDAEQGSHIECTNNPLSLYQSHLFLDSLLAVKYKMSLKTPKYKEIRQSRNMCGDRRNCVVSKPWQ
jgi:hypothetical protein